MIKRIISAICFLIFSACSGGGGDSQDFQGDACGLLNLPAKIIYGQECGSLSQSPVVRIRFVESSGAVSYCSGSVISSQDVLTAAHCFMNNPVQVAVIYGDAGEDLSEIRGREWHIHPEATFLQAGNISEAIKNDVAVIRLRKTIPLPSLPLLGANLLTGGEQVGIYGYGVDENGITDFQTLRAGWMNLTKVQETFFRADFDGTGSNTCLGDSGGPMIYSLGGIPAIAGTTSAGIREDCLEGDKSFFARTGYQETLDFIVGYVPDVVVY